jgi:hypothetical protein
MNSYSISHNMNAKPYISVEVSMSISKMKFFDSKAFKQQYLV